MPSSRRIQRKLQGDVAFRYLAAGNQQAQEKRQERQAREAEAREEGHKVSGVPPRIDDQPSPKAQRNFTDPESSIMKGADGFVQAYSRNSLCVSVSLW